MKRFLRRIVALVCSSVIGACAGGPVATAPAVSSLGAPTESAIQVVAEDVSSARTARVLSYHVMLLRTQKRGSLAAENRLKYPADLVRKKGPIMKTAASFNVYVNCKSGRGSCWGDPEGFLKNLTGSRFAGLLKQYTNSAAYTFGGAFTVRYRTYTKLLYQSDLLAVVHAALERNQKRAGYSAIYHVFLPKGTDTCFDRSRSCYSPDHPATFAFCAYHESVAFKDIPQHVIVTIEPYQRVGFCASRASSDATALTNSTASTLAHETFESITDPGPAFAWFNFTFYDEVADLCESFQWKIPVGGTVYSLQPMYSNGYHACAAGP